MREHTCQQCGIGGFSSGYQVPFEWLDRTITVRSLSAGSAHRVVVCSQECFADLVNEYESRGCEVTL